MKRAMWLVPAVLLLGAAGQEVPPADELATAPETLVAAEIEGRPAKLHLVSGGPDRLLLNEAFVAESGIKPATIMGRADLSIAGRREFKGRNRPLAFSVGGMAHKGRAFWFEGAPPSPGDGAVGPWALPQPRVTFVLRPERETDRRFELPLIGGLGSGSYTGWKDASFGMVVILDLDDPGPLPVATAAAGAAIAAAYGGTLSGPSWDVPIAFGVTRPVRLLTLERPFAMPPFAFTRIAVRVRDRIDEAGRGEAIPEADAVEDPDEIVVTAKAKGRPPAFGLTIPRPALDACARMTFDKVAKRISLWCLPSQPSAATPE